MREVGALEAKNTFGTLLDQVEAGEEVIITRRGKPVARLVHSQASTTTPAHQSAEAAARIRARAMAAMPMSWPEWKTLRDEGRR